MKTTKFRIYTIIADIIILGLAFLFMVWTKPASLKSYLPSHLPFFLLLAFLWIFVSLMNGKMHRGMIINLRSLFFKVLKSNLIALAIASLIMYSFREYSYSRTIVLGTVLVATTMEILAGMAYLAVKRAVVQEQEVEIKGKKRILPDETEMVETLDLGNGSQPITFEITDYLFNEIKKEAGEEVAGGIKVMVGNKAGKKHILLSTGTVLNVLGLPEKQYDYIINLRKINDIKNLNLFLEAINEKLKKGGYFLCFVETKNKRKKKILTRFPPGINYIFYTFDFLFNRVLPKLRITRGLWLFLTGEKYNVISRAEALGRLCRAGMKINREALIGGNLCIEVMKESEPEKSVNHYYGLLVALKRIGKEGKIIKVYKLRTMHPYSEYIQDYVYSLHNLCEGGKFENDFRVTSWGAFCRRIWLDELPMLINFFRGEMKIVGVRPLSKQYFSLYSKEMQERRIKYKPGLIPPFYADMPETIEEIQESEKRYLDAYDKSPFITDIKYFFHSVWNIIFHHARSN